MSDEIDDAFDEFFGDVSEESKEKSTQATLVTEPNEPETKQTKKIETQSEQVEQPKSDTDEIDDLFGDTSDTSETTSKAKKPETKTDTVSIDKTTTSTPTPSATKEVEITQNEIVITPKTTELDLLPESGVGKVVITIYSHKGHGKTYCALSFPGKIAAISFDYKTTPVAQRHYPNKYMDTNKIRTLEDLISMAKSKSEWILVWDGKKYYDESSPESKLSSAEVTFEYLTKLFNVIAKLEPDWVVIDGTEILHEICEMLMRYRNGLAPFQGISNRNLWKERRMYMRQLHKMAINAAKRGLIYTLYPEDREIKIVDGEIVDKNEIPKWIDIVLYETDTVIKCEQRWTEGIRKWFIRVESNKSPVLKLKEGMDIDVTDKVPYECIVE